MTDTPRDLTPQEAYDLLAQSRQDETIKVTCEMTLYEFLQMLVKRHPEIKTLGGPVDVEIEITYDPEKPEK